MRAFFLQADAFFDGTPVSTCRRHREGAIFRLELRLADMSAAAAANAGLSCCIVQLPGPVFSLQFFSAMRHGVARSSLQTSSTKSTKTSSYPSSFAGHAGSYCIIAP
ncbi:MAG: hypothetical protein K5657_06080 [Desulfovibrio sp.]|nr:hypothetical protein [Desulfovibrio sp.]